MSTVLADPLEELGSSELRGKVISAQPANDNSPDASPECICDSLVRDIQRLKLERAVTRQKLKRARRDTRRVRLKLSRLQETTRFRPKHLELRKVGETSLAEAVLAAQEKRQGALAKSVAAVALSAK